MLMRTKNYNKIIKEYVTIMCDCKESLKFTPDTIVVLRRLFPFNMNGFFYLEWKA